VEDLLEVASVAGEAAVGSMQQGIDYIGVAVVYFCHDGHGRFIMSKRNANARDENGRWDIGGGAVDPHDTVEHTLRKEIKEEYCTDVLTTEFLGYRDVHREHEGRKSHWVALDFNVLIDSTSVANGEPHKFDAVKLFTFATMPTFVHSQFPYFLELYRKRLG
jgi:ADP-ribose pyrophosphatase YjhB (NUDIX family)